MAWSSKSTIRTSTGVVGTEVYSDAVTLDPGESADVQVETNSSGTTDSLIVSVYTTLDDSTEDWSTVPRTSFLIDATSGSDCFAGFTISGVYKFRLGFVRDGSTDTLTTLAYVRTDGVSV